MQKHNSTLIPHHEESAVTSAHLEDFVRQAPHRLEVTLEEIDRPVFIEQHNLLLNDEALFGVQSPQDPLYWSAPLPGRVQKNGPF